MVSPSSRSEATVHPEAADFYHATLQWLLEQNIVTREMSLLVACGAELDHCVLSQLNFRTATISNLDEDLAPDTYAPFRHERQDVEALSLEDDAVDFCIAHNGLHHCVSPHQGLLELFRVARRGVVVFEPRDSFLTRCGVKLKFGQDYEIAAVAANGCIAGGVRNSAIPNYVYRWTEREIEKTIASACPWGRPRFIYRYALRIPWARLRMLNRRAFFWAVRLSQPALELFFRVFPKQTNGFAFIVLKPQVPQQLQPWLQLRSGEICLDREWVTRHYSPDRMDPAD